MIINIVLVSSLFSSLVCSQRFSKSIQTEARPAYLTNVIHTFAGNLDNWAEISINPNKQDQLANNNLIQNTPRGKFDPIYSNTPRNMIYSNKLAKGRSTPDVNTFNVGYNIRFGQNNDHYKQPKLTIRNGHFENAEIITGRKKKNEKVQAPQRNTKFPVFFDGLLNKKSNYQKQNEQRPTDIYGKVPDSIQVVQSTYQASTPWKNVSPNVEMTRSLEGPYIQEQVFQKTFIPKYMPHISSQNVESSNKFNHEQAIKNSQQFDFSNANGEIIVDNFPAGSDQYVQKLNFRTTKFLPTNNVNVEAHIPSHLKGVKPLPLDTSLLKEPVLMTDVKNTSKNSKILPIHFDLRPIQAAMEEETSHLRQTSPFLQHNRNF